MTDKPSTLITTNDWDALRAHTPARIALGRVGVSLPTRALLQFGLAHAQARDAVHHPLDVSALQAQLAQAGFNALQVSSNATDRHAYLLRPDLGRALRDSDRATLHAHAQTDIAIVIADGLSSLAIERHAVSLLQKLREIYSASWHSIPVVIAYQGRVAIGDEIGAALRAKLSVVLIGERPGLSSADSLGIYLTFNPRPGRMDSERNCISNIRPEGLSYTGAAHKLAFLMRTALQLQLSGIELKDDSDTRLIENTALSEAAIE